MTTGGTVNGIIEGSTVVHADTDGGGVEPQSSMEGGIIRGKIYEHRCKRLLA